MLYLLTAFDSFVSVTYLLLYAHALQLSPLHVVFLLLSLRFLAYSYADVVFSLLSATPPVSFPRFQNLEVTTENLSELLERDITTDISSEEIVKLKQQVCSWDEQTQT